MPEKETVEKAREDLQEGKSPTTAAGEFVREEMHHIREGKHGARSTKQAIAIALSKARRAGVPLKPPGRTAKPKTRCSATYATRAARRHRKPSSRRSSAVRGALKREGRSAASRSNLSRQARTTARRRGASSRQRAALKAVRTKGSAGRRRAAQKAARTRARRGTQRRAA